MKPPSLFRPTNGHKFTLPQSKHLWDGSTRPWKKGEKEEIYKKLAPVLDRERSRL